VRISAVLGEAFAVYRRLFRRSVVVAGLIFAVVSLAQALAARTGTLLALAVSLVLSLVGGLLVQGALVEVVRDLHEGRAPAPINVYYDRTRGRLGTLVGASFMYGLGALGQAGVTKALELNPTWAWGYAERGFIRLMQNREAEAQKDFAKCLEIDPATKTEIDKRVAEIKQKRAR